MDRHSHLNRAIAALVIASAVLAGCSGAATPTAAPAPATQVPLAALPKEITIQEAATRRDQGAFILDVREPSEWADMHIAGATLIPLGSLESRVSEVPKDRPVVVVCRSGNRSQRGRDILLGAGFTSVTSMSGGMNQWKAAGLPIQTGQ